MPVIPSATIPETEMSTTTNVSHRLLFASMVDSCTTPVASANSHPPALHVLVFLRPTKKGRLKPLRVTTPYEHVVNKGLRAFQSLELCSGALQRVPAVLPPLEGQRNFFPTRNVCSETLRSRQSAVDL